MKRTFQFIALMLIITSCGTSVKETSSKTDKKVQEFPSEEIASGFALYGASCGKCHTLFEVKDFSEEKWSKILPPMIKKAKLDDEQSQKVTAYVNWKLVN